MASFKFQVQETIYDGKSMLDEQNFYSQKQGGPSKLTDVLTYMLGDSNKNYPISMMTASKMASKGAYKEIDDVQYTYPVMGRDDKASVVAEDCTASSAVNGASPGIGQSIFKIRFTDNWIKRYYIIESARGVQAYVIGDPVKVGDAWEYSVRIDPADADTFCPDSELAAGVLWVDLNTAVAESESRTTESKMASPGLYKNQMGFIRAGFSFAGNASNKVMNINVQTDKGKTNIWMDFAMWQFEKRWLQEQEHVFWYSRYNRQENGSIALKDGLSGKVIPRGSGILEQIQNKSTFSELTYSTLSNKIGEALFGQSDTGNMNITLFTGLGGLEDIDRAMKAEGVSFLTDFTGVADKFVSGSGNGSHDLMLGGFFTGFYHINGYTIKVKHNPIFDMGRVALKSPIHPRSGKPLESHRLVFIDDNMYDGQPNLQQVAQKGRAFAHGIIAGLTPPPRSLSIADPMDITAAAAPKLATDVDKSAYTRMKSCGIQLLRGNKCFDMQCIAGL